MPGIPSSPGDRSPDGASRPERAAILGLAFLAVALSFSVLLSADQVPTRRDLLVFFVPFRVFLSESLGAGDLPLWNPWTFLGTPFLASLQSGVLYPPSALLLLPFPLGFNLFLLLHYFVALGGAWLLFRERGLGPVAAATGGLTFAVGGGLVSLLNVTNHLQSAAWAPFALWLWSRHVRSGTPLTGAAVVAVIAVQVLGGSPETVVMTLGILGLWTLRRSLPEGRAAVRRTLVLGILAALAAGITAVQLLPTAELTRHSLRGTAFTFEQVSFWSLQPASLLQLLFPHSSSLVGAGEEHTVGSILEAEVPWLASLYLGLVPLCLLVAGLVRGRERMLWGGIAAAGVILALGKHGPLFPLLYDAWPALFGKFRFPEKFWFLTHFAAALLAAEGMDRLARGDHLARRVAVTAALGFAAVGLLVLGLRAAHPVAFLQMLAILRGQAAPLEQFAALGVDLVFKSERLLVVLGAFLAVLVLEGRKLVRPRLAGVLLVTLVAADLGGAHHDLNLSLSWSELADRPPLVDVGELRRNRLRVFRYQTVSSPRWGRGGDDIAGLEERLPTLRSTDDLRQYALAEWPSLPGNAGILHGVGTVAGGEGIDRAEIEMLRDVLAILPRERAVHLLRIFSTGALIGSAPLETASLRPVARDGAYFAYEIEAPVPRAYLVSRLAAEAKRLDAFNALVAPGFDPALGAVVERLPPGWTDRPAESEPGTAAIAVHANDLVVVRTRADQPAFLVLNDAHFPGWEADVDGEPVEIVRTNALVRGVPVPAGEHEVTFRYRPLSFRIGAGISAITAILSLTWLAIRVRHPAGPGSR